MNGPAAPGSLPWLEWAVQSGDLWDTFRAQLVDALGDLDHDSFVIVDVRARSGEGNDWVPVKYLQYAFRPGDPERVLLAEASSRFHQRREVIDSPAVAAEFERRGWPLEAESRNHARTFAWPEEIEVAVEASLDLIRDVWRTPHPEALLVRPEKFLR